MASLFERRSFKIALVATTSVIALGTAGGLLSLGWIKKIQREREIQAQKDADWEYRERFRLGLNRIRQNLKLDHFLAAYKNLERLPLPPRDDLVAKTEYVEVLQRIGRGLLGAQLLKESEDVFQSLRDFDGGFEVANRSISEIESKRRVESARLHFDQGRRLYDEKRYHDAFGEFQKADIDLNSVENLKFDDVREQKEKLIAAVRQVKFHLYIESAEKHIRDTRQYLKLKDFEQVQKSLGKAAGSVGRAAFLNPDSDEIRALRVQLDDLDGELGYQLPNSVPIFNRFDEASVGRVPRLFRLTGYEFDPNPDQQNSVKINLKFIRDNQEPYFIIRYRIYFVNNRDFFNGHYLMPEAQHSDSALPGQIIYQQEIPERFKGIPIQRIEVKVFNSDDIIVSHITRAFRHRG